MNDVVTASANPQVGGAAMAPDKTILANAAASPILSQLTAAVNQAGLADTLSEPGPFTLFAPNDAAFAQVPAVTRDGWARPAQKVVLAGVLKYHVVPGKLTVRHVLISTRSRSEADARTLAHTVEQEAKAHPDRFDALIEKYSDDPAKATSHGVLEQVGEKGKYVAAFVRAAKALAKPGDISPVVGTPFALHVIQLVERTPDRQQSFDEVKDDILKRLASRFVDKAVREHADALRNLPMNADPALVASLRTRYGAVAPVPGEQPKAAAGK